MNGENSVSNILKRNISTLKTGVAMQQRQATFTETVFFSAVDEAIKHALDLSLESINSGLHGRAFWVWGTGHCRYAVGVAAPRGAELFGIANGAEWSWDHVKPCSRALVAVQS